MYLYVDRDSGDEFVVIRRMKGIFSYVMYNNRHLIRVSRKMFANN